MNDLNKNCPYCNQEMSEWMPPPESDFQQHIHYVCFNDECSYYKEGWEWMRKQYNQNVSYRFYLNPETGEKGPLPVWSSSALRSGIVK